MIPFVIFTTAFATPLKALREISLLGSLSHPNVIKLLDVAVSSELGKWYIVMEEMDVDLATLVLGAKSFPFSGLLFRVI